MQKLKSKFSFEEVLFGNEKRAEEFQRGVGSTTIFLMSRFILKINSRKNEPHPGSTFNQSKPLINSVLDIHHHCLLAIGEMKPNNRQSWNRKDGTEERHKGSVDLEIIKKSDAYQRKIDQGETAAKRKYAICFGYLGSKYQGLQINPGAETVEAELEKALLLCGGIQECNFGYMQKVQWTRAARTGGCI